MAALTVQQQAQVAAYFAQNVYVAGDQTATNGTDVLAAAAAAVDAAIVIAAMPGAASISIAGSVVGNFTAAQLELLIAHVLMKRAGAI